LERFSLTAPLLTLSRFLAKPTKKPRLDLGMGAGSLGRQAQQVNRLGGFAEALQAGGTVALKVLVKVRGGRVRERPQQEQFVKVF
jgi:hypothetical protein